MTPGMTPERLALIRAHIQEGGILESAAAKELLSHAETLAVRVSEAEHMLASGAQTVTSLASLLEDARTDADRLAEWIVRHPSPDAREVLTLHDRTRT